MRISPRKNATEPKPQRVLLDGIPTTIFAKLIKKSVIKPSASIVKLSYARDRIEDFSENKSSVLSA